MSTPTTIKWCRTCGRSDNADAAFDKYKIPMSAYGNLEPGDSVAARNAVIEECANQCDSIALESTDRADPKLAEMWRCACTASADSIRTLKAQEQHTITVMSRATLSVEGKRIDVQRTIDYIKRQVGEGLLVESVPTHIETMPGDDA